MNTLKIISINMHCGMEDDYPRKASIIAETIAKHDVDVVFLQECVQKLKAPVSHKKFAINIRQGNLCVDLVKRLAVLGIEYDYYFDWGKYGFEVLEEGLAVLSKKKIVSASSRYVSEVKDINDWKSRKIIRVGINGYPDLYLYNVHLGWWDDEEEPFKGQMDRLNDWMVESPGVNHLLVGDFNAPYQGLAYDYMKKVGLRDLYLEVDVDHAFQGTFHGHQAVSDLEVKNLNTRIDYVMCKGNVQPLSGQRLFTGREEAIVSDHYGLMMELL